MACCRIQNVCGRNIQSVKGNHVSEAFMSFQHKRNGEGVTIKLFKLTLSYGAS